MSKVDHLSRKHDDIGVVHGAALEKLLGVLGVMSSFL